LIYNIYICFIENYIMLKILKNIIVSIFSYALILYLVYKYSWWWFDVEATQYNVFFTFILLALFFWIVNNIIKIVLKILTIPLKYLTLWSFSLVLNMTMVYLFEYLVNNYSIGVRIHLGTFVQVFVLSLFISLLYILIKKIL
jgi:uncharacterized membrane protein YvlD (DUF360 family)